MSDKPDFTEFKKVIGVFGKKAFEWASKGGAEVKLSEEHEKTVDSIFDGLDKLSENMDGVFEKIGDIFETIDKIVNKK